jgi:hypothetical protein
MEIVLTGKYCFSTALSDGDQWRNSPDRALASLTGFMIVYSTMWGYQLNDRPVLDTLSQLSETSSSNYKRLVAKQGNTGEKWPLNFAGEHLSCSYGNLRHGPDGLASPPKESVLRILSPLKSIVLGRVWTRDPWVQWQAR